VTDEEGLEHGGMCARSQDDIGSDCQMPVDRGLALSYSVSRASASPGAVNGTVGEA
jgi:hypothetical protein